MIVVTRVEGEGAKVKPSPERLQHMFELRDAALVVIRRAGQWQRVGSWRLTIAESGGLKIGYQSPFNFESADLSSASSYAHEVVRRRASPDLPHKLDIWAPKKVLSMQWDDAGAVNLISFKPGEWEAALSVIWITPILTANQDRERDGNRLGHPGLARPPGLRRGQELE